MQNATLEKKHVILALVLLGTGAFIVFLTLDTEALQANLSEWLDKIDHNKGLLGWSGIFAAASIASALGLPRQVIAVSCGHLFGGFQGALIGTCIALMGCLLDFYLARLLFRPLLQRHFEHRIAQLDQLLLNDPFLKALTLRLFPSGSNLLTSLLGGASSVRPLPFFTGTGIGYLPQMIILSFLGAGATWVDSNRTTLTIVTLAATILFALNIYRRFKQRG